MKTPDYNYPDFVHEVSFCKRPEDSNTVVTLRHWDSKGVMHKSEYMYNLNYKKNQFTANLDMILDWQIDGFKDYLQSNNVI